MAENLRAAGHPGEPEIGGVGEQRRHQRHAVLGRRSRAQMTEPIGKSCPAMHFGEKLGDAQTRQHAIEPPRDILDFVGFVLADGADRKPFCGDDRFGELAGGRERIDFPKPGFEEADALGAPVIEATGDGKPQLVVPLPRGECFRRQEKIIEGPERAAAFDPDVAGSQAIAQRHHDRDLISPAIDGDAGSDELAPCRFQKRRRRARRQVSLRRRVKFAQHVERGEQRIVELP